MTKRIRRPQNSLSSDRRPRTRPRIESSNFVDEARAIWDRVRNHPIANMTRGIGETTRLGRELADQYRQQYPTAPSGPRRITAAPRGVRSGRSVVKRAHTHGTVGRRFKKRVKRSKANRFIKYGYIRKREVGGVVSDNQCVYIGHNSNALTDMWISMVYSIVRMFARKIGQDFVAVDDLVLGSTANPNLQWTLNYKSAAGGVLNNAFISTGASISWGGLGDLLSQLLLSSIANNNYYELVDISLKSLDTVANTPDIPYTVFQCKQLYVTVVGNSNMVLQNTTLAAVADGDGDVIENVANNPITGKMYNGYGQAYPLAAQYNTAGGNRCLQTDASSGFMTLDITQDAGMSLAMRNLITKPPPHFAFHGMTGSMYVRVAPGEIRRSKIVKSYRFDFCKWVQMLLPYLQLSPEGNSSNIKFIGKSRVFGLERLLDSRSDEAPIRIAYEINLTTSAIAQFYPTMKCLPQLFVQ